MDTATEKPVATKKESDVDLSESETWSLHEEVTGRPVAYKTATVKSFASSESESKSWKNRMVTQFTHVSTHSSLHGSSLLDRQENPRPRTR